MTMPRMMTINECAKEFKGVGLSAYRLRQLACTEQIVTIKAGNKVLINVDKLIEYLNNPTQKDNNKPEKEPIPVLVVKNT